MYVHKPKDTDKHEHFIKHLVYILIVTARGIGFSLFFPLFFVSRFFFLPQSTVDDRFQRYRPIAGGPHTGQFVDRYVPPSMGPYRLAQAARSAQTNTNSLSSQSQASSQQLASSVAQQITGAQSFPALHSIPSSQSLKVTGSPPHQPYVPPLTFQVQPGTGLTAPDNSTQKPREVETKSDGMGAQSVQNYTSNTNITNPERDVSMVSLQPVNKQQHHAQLPQSSFSVSGATSSYNTHAYPRPSMSSSTSIRPQNLDSHTRQVSVTPGAVSTQLRPAQSMSVINVPKYEQNPANEAKRQQVSSITASQHNPIAWQLSANKDQKGNTFPSMAIKQELVDQSSEPPNKSHFASSESTSFGSAHVNQGNHALGSSSTTGTTQISGSVPSQGDQIVQVSIYKSNAIS
ncbi:hypothetical protein GW17_00056631 [Ensete ventricosum]|nr:hypothetical protein GW17_00056631 [Ensete ventricosum]